VPSVFGIPVEFVLFASTLLGVALFHHRTLQVALAGLTAISLYKLAFTGFATGSGWLGLALHFEHEWVTFANLLCLLIGFALLARHFEDSHLPLLLPRYLPDGWTGGFALLALVFVMSSFLDNIAAALIGGAMAHTLFGGRVHIGYVAAIVAASNAGGSGSVVGDTTTTMMWIDGVAPVNVLHAYIAAGVALFVFGIPASLQQHRLSPILRDPPPHPDIDWGRIGVVAFVLLAAVGVNVTVNTHYTALADDFPFLGATVAMTLLISTAFRRPDWSVVPAALKGSVFLLALVGCASLMPVEALPRPTWQTTMALGFVSAVFDNIPLTALALNQGGYDWGVLAYAVGFGGSMIWFGSSAGVAISSLYPHAKSTGQWIKDGWHVAAAYVIGFTALMLVLGWDPHAPHKP
jgi:Na+/H+ antiporter NhaD/arsenite permease-like protein